MSTPINARHKPALIRRLRLALIEGADGCQLPGNVLAAQYQRMTKLILCSWACLCMHIHTHVRTHRHTVHSLTMFDNTQRQPAQSKNQSLLKVRGFCRQL